MVPPKPPSPSPSSPRTKQWRKEEKIDTKSRKKDEIKKIHHIQNNDKKYRNYNPKK